MIIVFNYGSSSIKTAIFDGELNQVFKTQVNLAKGESEQERQEIARKAALNIMLDKKFKRALKTAVTATVHRVVHGGHLDAPKEINADIKAQIKAFSSFAPLHNPGSLAIIEAVESTLPAVPHFACFDTAFHRTRPAYAKNFALPRDLAQELKIERYGFHGINSSYIAGLFPQDKEEDKRMLVCHIGAGASITAVRAGKSLDNTMGFTPLDGLIMNTRVGSLDPGALLYLMRTKGLTPQETERMLSSDSGILGLCGKTDLKSLLDELAGNLAENTGPEETGVKQTEVKETGLAKTTDLLQETWESYVYRLVTQAGAMTFAMGGLDRIVFSGGAGENSAELRAAFINKLQFMHAELDQEKNRDKALQEKERKKFGYADITGNSKIRIFIGYAEEEKAMAMTAKTMMKSGGG
ncbi:MAG: acetate/propionate family kinase [Candidatus Obscuribacter phosphatis]|uniref:Acetate kinase n=1 Tax=Candidatus Obscuribacter phosphatis TaxID=1906157 RepID=A0A8J7PN88_9BACT|nr:acetate/propionate family kinase [Candidatus Obscuribacter phosphatis]